MLRRRVLRDAFVEAETNRYPVTFAWCGADVLVELTSTEERIVHQGEPLVYEREPGRHRVIRWRVMPRPLPKHLTSAVPANLRGV